MGSFSNFWENEILDHLFGKGAYDPPTIFIGLCTADPTDAGTGASCNEVPNSGGYVRKATTAASWSAASGGALSNAATLEFAEATGNWGVVSHFALFNSGTYGAGNMLAHGALAASKTVNTNDTARFVAGELDVSLD